MLVFRGREEGTDELTLTASFQHGTSPEEVLISELNTLKRYFTINLISFFHIVVPLKPVSVFKQYWSGPTRTLYTFFLVLADPTFKTGRVFVMKTLYKNLGLYMIGNVSFFYIFSILN